MTTGRINQGAISSVRPAGAVFETYDRREPPNYSELLFLFVCVCVHAFRRCLFQNYESFKILVANEY